MFNRLDKYHFFPHNFAFTPASSNTTSWEQGYIMDFGPLIIFRILIIATNYIILYGTKSFTYTNSNLHNSLWGRRYYHFHFIEKRENREVTCPGSHSSIMWTPISPVPGSLLQPHTLLLLHAARSYSKEDFKVKILCRTCDVQRDLMEHKKYFQNLCSFNHLTFSHSWWHKSLLHCANRRIERNLS